MLATRLDSVLSAVKGKAAPVVAPSAPAPAAAAASDFESAALFNQIKARVDSATAAEKDTYKKKVKAIFQFDIKNKDGKVQIWTIDFKDKIAVTTGNGPKPDVTIAVGDKDFLDLAAGKLNGQKAFMSGKIKVKGAIMLAMKLDGLLKDLQPKSKL